MDLNEEMVDIEQYSNEKSKEAVHYVSPSMSPRSSFNSMDLRTPEPEKKDLKGRLVLPPEIALRNSFYESIRDYDDRQIEGCSDASFEMDLEPDSGVKRISFGPVSYTHLRAHETSLHLVCRLLLEKKKKQQNFTKTLTDTQKEQPQPRQSNHKQEEIGKKR
eukprot:TRINITY_DN37296_c0_g1_i3.p1 TRINITY_DN37296_c0_g1~~TRINITY_DN37296_c0_g1_i3.p1  ORF type:complete len:162 (+),score=38.61 TRINITY_DN37296_c0_g1_i3:230-715(+)